METDELRKKTRVGDLAKRLRLDIAERSLRSGDYYLTAAAAGEKLGVSSAMANRAMNLLAEKDLLIRHRSRGTFVGPGFDGTVEAKTAVHMIEILDGGETSDLQASEMMSALRTVIPDARLVCHFFPENNSVRQIHDEVERLFAEKSFGGLILSSCPREVQADVDQAGVPAVVWGSTYSGINLPYVDLDQSEIGRLMAKQAVEAGSRRLIFVTRESWREGDTRAFHGITQKAHKAGWGPNAVRIQNLPEAAGESVMQSILEPMIRQAANESDEPVAFLCRSEPIAQQLHQASQSCDAWDPQRMTIVFDATFGNSPNAPPGLFVMSKKSLQETFSVVGRVLCETMKTDSQKTASVKLPVVCGQNSDARNINPQNTQE